MKKVFKGCFLTFGIIIGVLIISLIGLFIYWQSPNKIEFSDKPIKIENHLQQLNFPGREIPKIILKQDEKNIQYQALLIDDGLDMTVIYKVVYKLDYVITLDSYLPLNDTDIEKLNSKISFSEIENGFKPKIRLPDNNKVPSGRHLTIYTGVNDSIFMSLEKGSYSYFYEEKDKVGTVTDILIYDKVSKILYYERNRYFAFQ